MTKFMCRDPHTAERFYVSLPDKETWYQARKLRLKALQISVAEPNEDTSDYEPILTSTLETSSEDEQPVYDDRSESTSGMSASSEPHHNHPKRRLHSPEESGNVEVARIYTPSKCIVRVQRLRKPITNFFSGKMFASKPMWRYEEGSEQAPLAELKCVPAALVDNN